MAKDLSKAEIMKLAIFAALLASIAEISLSFILLRFGLIDWISTFELPPELSPIVPVIYVPLFCLLGVGLIVTARILPWFGQLQGACFSLSILPLYVLIIVSGHLRGKRIVIGTIILLLAMLICIVIDKKSDLFLRFFNRVLKWAIVLTLALMIGIPCWHWAERKLAAAKLPAAHQGAPNVLLIIIDTLRADHLSAYGYSRETTPHLEQMARQGALFETAISSCSWTLPSHASIFTGLYPRQHGADLGILDNRHLTLAEAYKSRGYYTAAFSANQSFFCRRTGLDRGFLTFSDVSNRAGEWPLRTTLFKFISNRLSNLGFPYQAAGRDAADINESFLHWADKGTKRPFFAALNYMDVHGPYLPPTPYRKMFAAASPPDEIKLKWLHNPNPIRSVAGARTWLDAYDGAIRYVDDQINALLKGLRKRGLDSNTLVVITADHGEAFGDHGLVIHGNSLYLDTIHVPLIFRWPGHVPESLRIKEPVSLNSLPSTLLSLTGGTSDARFGEPSMMLLMKSANASAKKLVCSELPHLPASFGTPGDPSRYEAMTSMVRDKWHYIVHEYAGEELYNWKEDPAELHDLSTLPESEGVLRAFRQSRCY